MLEKVFQKLKLVNNITDKVVLSHPITTITSDANDMFVNINLSDIEPFEEIGIYELNKTLNLVGLFENYELNVKDNNLEINSPGKNGKIRLADLEIMSDYRKDPNIIESSYKFDAVSDFELTKEHINKFKKAISILNNLDGVKFTGVDNDTKVGLAQVNRFEICSDDYEETFLGSSSKNFEITISSENFLKLPVLDYKVKVFYNSEKDRYRIIFEAGENAEIKIAIALI